jgi:hypothetical protein
MTSEAPMAGPDAILARLDAAIRELLELRAAVVGAEAADECSSTTTPADDLADALIDTTSAGARTGFARDTTAMWCRTVPGVGVWRALAGTHRGTAAAHRKEKASRLTAVRRRDDAGSACALRTEDMAVSRFR